jgi:hypothetical protein
MSSFGSFFLLFSKSLLFRGAGARPLLLDLLRSLAFFFRCVRFRFPAIGLFSFSGGLVAHPGEVQDA